MCLNCFLDKACVFNNKSINLQNAGLDKITLGQSSPDELSGPGIHFCLIPAKTCSALAKQLCYRNIYKYSPGTRPTLTVFRKKLFSSLPQQPWAIQIQRPCWGCQALQAPMFAWHRHHPKAWVCRQCPGHCAGRRGNILQPHLIFLFSKIKSSLLLWISLPFFLKCSSASICPVLIFITLDILNFLDTRMILLSFQKFFPDKAANKLSQAFTSQHNVLLL